MSFKKHLLMHLASFGAMFITMYAMVDSFNHFFININKVYMSLLMVSAMVVVNTLLMPSMYQTQKIRLGFMVGGVFLVFTTLYFIRTQAFVTNKPFLRSMIPHHSSAILMCEEAAINDSEIETLCDQIIETQKQEIDQMKSMLQQKY